MKVGEEAVKQMMPPHQVYLPLEEGETKDET
jgi:hypothetical protein